MLQTCTQQGKNSTSVSDIDSVPRVWITLAEIKLPLETLIPASCHRSFKTWRRKTGMEGPRESLASMSTRILPAASIDASRASSSVIRYAPTYCASCSAIYHSMTYCCFFFLQNPSNSSRLQRKQTHTTGRLQSIKPYRIEEMMQTVTVAIPRLHSENPWSIINSLPNSRSCFTSFMQQLINLNVRAWHNYQLDAQPMEQCQILLNHIRWCQIKIRFNLSFIDSELKQPTSDLKLHIFLSDIL